MLLLTISVGTRVLRLSCCHCPFFRTRRSHTVDPCRIRIDPLVQVGQISLCSTLGIHRGTLSTVLYPTHSLYVGTPYSTHTTYLQLSQFRWSVHPPLLRYTPKNSHNTIISHQALVIPPSWLGLAPLPFDFRIPLHSHYLSSFSSHSSHDTGVTVRFYKDARGSYTKIQAPTTS